MPLDDQQRAAALAELGRRRTMVWLIGLCFVAAAIAAVPISAWIAIVVAVVGLVVTLLAVARYRQLVAAVGQD